MTLQRLENPGFFLKVALIWAALFVYGLPTAQAENHTTGSSSSDTSAASSRVRASFSDISTNLLSEMMKLLSKESSDMSRTQFNALVDQAVKKAGNETKDVLSGEQLKKTFDAEKENLNGKAGKEFKTAAANEFTDRFASGSGNDADTNAIINAIVKKFLADKEKENSKNKDKRKIDDQDDEIDRLLNKLAAKDKDKRSQKNPSDSGSGKDSGGGSGSGGGDSGGGDDSGHQSSQDPNSNQSAADKLKALAGMLSQAGNSIPPEEDKKDDGKDSSLAKKDKEKKDDSVPYESSSSSSSSLDNTSTPPKTPDMPPSNLAGMELPVANTPSSTSTRNSMGSSNTFGPGFSSGLPMGFGVGMNQGMSNAGGNNGFIDQVTPGTPTPEPVLKPKPVYNYQRIGAEGWISGSEGSTSSSDEGGYYGSSSSTRKPTAVYSLFEPQQASVGGTGTEQEIFKSLSNAVQMVCKDGSISCTSTP